MGEEAPDCTDKFAVLGSDSVSQGHETSTLIGNKIYVIGGSEPLPDGSIRVKIFNKLTGEWSDPTVLGTKPISSKGHSALLTSSDRVLILKSESDPGDCTWFLEVDTPFVNEQKKLLATEVVAWSKGVSGEGPKPIVISGPSGVGKGTLISKLMKEFPSMFGFSVSHTTRAPREKEVNGVHYHFTERSVMEKDIRDGKFLETASVHGNLYGTSIEAVEVVADAGKRCILDIDVQGARSVRASLLDAIFIFICPPEFDELERRLRARGTETEEQIQKRLRNAKAELDQGRSPGLFDYLLVNDDLEACYENLKKLLGIDGTSDASYHPVVEDFKIPVDYSISKKDDKVLINFETTFELDLSSIKGGAPGRTRGLKISPISLEAENTNRLIYT